MSMSSFSVEVELKWVLMVHCILKWMNGERSCFKGNGYADECLSSWTPEVSALFLTVLGREKQVHRVIQTLGFTQCTQQKRCLLDHLLFLFH